MARRNDPPKSKAASAKGGGERRSRTVERREERQKERQRRRQLTILGVVAVIAVLAILFIVLANQPAEAPIPAESAATYDGIPQTISDEGFPQLGNPDAPVRVVEYASFDCSHCEEFHRTVVPDIVERVRAGEVLFTYAPMFGTGGIANGEGAAKAALCAGYQDAFWTFHDALFNWQTLYANQAFTSQRLSSGVDNLGIDKGAWNACMGSSR
ncbi:MAG: thioredoxin domain-containing protein, partial [Burkholderiales bacterium]|nr:thioredoxin domain-containing protein [Anaerolineae bacterium]